MIYKRVLFEEKLFVLELTNEGHLMGVFLGGLNITDLLSEYVLETLAKRGYELCEK